MTLNENINKKTVSIVIVGLEGIILRVIQKEFERNVLDLSKTEVKKVLSILKKIKDLRSKSVYAIRKIIRTLISENIYTLYIPRRTEWKRLGASTVYNVVRKRKVLSCEKESTKEKTLIGKIFLETYLICSTKPPLPESRKFIYEIAKTSFYLIKDFLLGNIPDLEIKNPALTKNKITPQEILDETKKFLDFYIYLNDGVENRFYMNSRKALDQIESLLAKAETRKLQRLQEIQARLQRL